MYKFVIKTTYGEEHTLVQDTAFGALLTMTSLNNLSKGDGNILECKLYINDVFTVIII